jgi:hypothetical protein
MLDLGSDHDMTHEINDQGAHGSIVCWAISDKMELNVLKFNQSSSQKLEKDI